MNRSLKLGSVAIQYSIQKELTRQADWFDQELRDLFMARGHSLFSPGKTMQFGWSRLTFVASDQGLRIHEPDFAGDPATETRDDLTVTITVLAQQADIRKSLNIEPVSVDFLDQLYFVEGALEAGDVFFQRGEGQVGISGWVMKLHDKPHQDGPYAWFFVYELLQVLPAAMAILTLPVGYIAVFLGETLDAILDENDRKVYTAS